MTNIDLLRVILLSLGIVIVLIIYIDGKRRNSKKKKVRLKAPKNDEVFDEPSNASQSRLTEQMTYRQEITPIEPLKTSLKSEESAKISESAKLKASKSVEIAPKEKKLAPEETPKKSEPEEPKPLSKKQKIKKVDKTMTDSSPSLQQISVDKPAINTEKASVEAVQKISLKEDAVTKEPEKKTISLDTVIVESKDEKQLFDSELQNKLDAVFKDVSVEKAFPKDQNLITIGVFAGEGKKFGGYELLQAIQANGFYYGDMQIFHHYGHDLTLSKKLFSLASATEPGDFDLNNMGGFFCNGLILFMNLQEHQESAPIFELMIDTASQLSDDINGVLILPEKKTFTKENVDALRQQILENKSVTH